MKVYIFTNDHRVKDKRVRASNLTFNDGNRSYTISPADIYTTRYPNKPKREGKPISIYFENNPQPVGYFEGEAFKDRSGEYLERAIAINAVKQQSSQPIGRGIMNALGALGSLISLSNIFILIVVASLVYAYITGEFM